MKRCVKSRRIEDKIEKTILGVWGQVLTPLSSSGDGPFGGTVMIVYLMVLLLALLLHWFWQGMKPSCGAWQELRASLSSLPGEWINPWFFSDQAFLCPFRQSDFLVGESVGLCVGVLVCVLWVFCESMYDSSCTINTMIRSSPTYSREKQIVIKSSQ